jgi:pimeloyl-ACP methyl ester carboxylesterase
MSRTRNAWAISRPEVALHWFAKPGGQNDNFDMFPELDRIRCPTLVIGGEDDPMHPIERQVDLAATLPPHLVQFERFADRGHGVVPDAPERAMACCGSLSCDARLTRC